jgi:hypothetical protein
MQILSRRHVPQNVSALKADADTTIDGSEGSHSPSPGFKVMGYPYTPWRFWKAWQ